MSSIEPVAERALCVEFIESCYGECKTLGTRKGSVDRNFTTECQADAFAAVIWELIKSALLRKDDRRRFVDEITALSFPKEEEG